MPKTTVAIVRIPFEDSTGAHDKGEEITFPSETDAEVAELTRLVEYGVVEANLAGPPSPPPAPVEDALAPAKPPQIPPEKPDAVEPEPESEPEPDPEPRSATKVRKSTKKDQG